VRANDSRGRHTTTSRVLMPLPQGGCLIDTPGMREVKLSGDEDIVDAFEDIEALAADCRFRDCVHGNEPGCAVHAAIEDGSLDEARFLHYLKLRGELEVAAITQAARRAEEALLKKAAHKRNKDKLGRR
jgi:ribosome biogenesis GTPase